MESKIEFAIKLAYFLSGFFAACLFFGFVAAHDHSEWLSEQGNFLDWITGLSGWAAALGALWIGQRTLNPIMAQASLPAIRERITEINITVRVLDQIIELAGREMLDEGNQLKNQEMTYFQRFNEKISTILDPIPVFSRSEIWAIISPSEILFEEMRRQSMTNYPHDIDLLRRSTINVDLTLKEIIERAINYKKKLISELERQRRKSAIIEAKIA